MSGIKINITDQTNGKEIIATVPTNVPIRRLLPALVKKMGLPDGTYKFVLKRTGKELASDEILELVNADDYFTILPSIFADEHIHKDTSASLFENSTIISQVHCNICHAQIEIGQSISQCSLCSVLVHYECGEHTTNGLCPNLGCNGRLQILQPEKVKIVVSGSNAEEVKSVARSLLEQAQNNRKDKSPTSLNINGNVSGSTIIIGNDNETQNSTKEE